MNASQDPDEGDRLVAAINGSYLAKHFPQLWYKQEQVRREIESGLHIERDKLRAQLQSMLKNRKDL